MRFENVIKDFNTEDGRAVRALDDFSLEVKRGELILMMGPNGSGKSTTFRLLDGEESPTKGRIAWDGSVNGRNGKAIVAHVPQDPRSLSFPEMSLEEHLLMAELSSGFARFWSRGVTGSRRQRYRELLEKFDVQPLADALSRPLRTLSGGWQQIFVMLCAALGPSLRDGGQAPDITLLDEPSSSLDVANSQICLDLIRRLHADGHTIIMATHNADLIEMAERLVVMRMGRLAADLSREEVEAAGRDDIKQLLIDHYEASHRANSTRQEAEKQ